MNYYNEIKEQLINNEITKKIKDYSKNKSDLNTYYNVGKILSEAGKHYGERIIKEYSIKLTKETNKKYNSSTLKRMRQFYLLIEKGAPLAHQLSWSHYQEIIPLKEIHKIKFYIEISIKNNLTKRELRERIKNKEYERLDISTKQKLIEGTPINVQDLVKNPIIIKNSNSKEITERVLQQLILEDIPSFLKELGNSFSFISNEYKIKIGERYNYIDLLLYNYEYNCFVVIELKITELKKEHIGQIHTYMNYIDKELRTIHQDKTIGIIICKKDNQFIMEYCSDERILTREYRLI
jgi:predicted nuclease of restriction endonuclease-like (RecB) superfamily